MFAATALLHRICRRASHLLLGLVKGSQESYSFLATPLHVLLLRSEFTRLLKIALYANEQTRELSRTLYQVGEEKKVKCLIFPEDICYYQISSSSSQVCSIKCIIQSTGMCETYCKSNLLRQVVFNYACHFKERSILSI